MLSSSLPTKSLATSQQLHSKNFHLLALVYGFIKSTQKLQTDAVVFKEK